MKQVIVFFDRHETCVDGKISCIGSAARPMQNILRFSVDARPAVPADPGVVALFGAVLALLVLLGRRK
jgi:hypothetical protein